MFLKSSPQGLENSGSRTQGPSGFLSGFLITCSPSAADPYVRQAAGIIPHRTGAVLKNTITSDL